MRFGTDVYRFIFAAKNRTEAVDRTFREAIHTFRRMTLAEARSARPLRLKMVMVRAGDTPEKLARRMAPGDRPAERFRVLNGLGPTDKLTVGEQVKIVVE